MSGETTVLILEDDPGVAHLERLRLERAGYTVWVAETSDEAHAAIARGGVDLLVLDYRLQGGTSGLDVHRRLRAAGLDVPSVLVTGFSDERLLAEALRAGVRDFVPKTPDYLDFLAPTVDRVLGQVRTERQLAEERAKLIRERAARAETEAARAILEDVDRRKDEFLAMLAHELRNPLAAIGNAVRVLKLDDAPQDRAWALNVADRQVAQLTRLIDDLLDVSRINSGKITLRAEPVDGAAVAARAADVVRPLVAERGHTLETTGDAGPLWLTADPARLEQVLVNLLTNAAKYTNRGGRIRLDARRAGAAAVFTVSDTGVGIPPEMLARIFDMFTQVDASANLARGGLGIGLSLVRRLVELHGGTIAAESQGQGQGSTFRVRLPAAAPAPAAAGVAPAPPAQRAAEHRRVLIVDDNEDTVQGMAKLLTRAGYAVQTAHDGPSALDAAQRFEPDCVLLDIGLPGRDGFEVGRLMRAESCCRNATFIAVSGYARDQDRERSRANGFDHHLVKPVDYDALLPLLAGLRPS